MKKASPSPSLNLSMFSDAFFKCLRMVRRHKTLLVVLLIGSVLLYSAWTVNVVLSVGDDQAYREEQADNRIRSRFDQDTIRKIDDLNISSEATGIELPPGRRNPFAEQ